MPSVPATFTVGAAAVLVAAGLLWVTLGRDVFLAMMASTLALCF